jgi:translation initiation factor IF-1
MAKKNIEGKKFTFQSKLANWAEGMDYCAIPVPASVTKALGTTAAVLVMATVNNSKPFKVSLFPAGGGKHYIRVRKKVRLEVNLNEGDRVKVNIHVLDRDKDAAIPKDLEKTLRAEGVLKDFKAITPGARNYIIRRIEDAAKAETRVKRIQEAVKAAYEKREKKGKISPP